MKDSALPSGYKESFSPRHGRDCKELRFCIAPCVQLSWAPRLGCRFKGQWQLHWRLAMQLGPELHQQRRHQVTEPPSAMHAQVTADAQRNQRALFTMTTQSGVDTGCFRMRNAAGCLSCTASVERDTDTRFVGQPALPVVSQPGPAHG
jgi:hypothetical protein